MTRDLFVGASAGLISVLAIYVTYAHPALSLLLLLAALAALGMAWLTVRRRSA